MFARVALFAQANTIATIPIVVAIHWALLPLTTVAGVSCIAGTHTTNTFAVSTAPCLAKALAVRVKCVFGAHTTDWDRNIVHEGGSAKAVSGTTVAARISKWPPGRVLPFFAGHSKVLLATNALAEL